MPDKKVNSFRPSDSVPQRTRILTVPRPETIPHRGRSEINPPRGSQSPSRAGDASGPRVLPYVTSGPSPFRRSPRRGDLRPGIGGPSPGPLSPANGGFRGPSAAGTWWRRRGPGRLAAGAARGRVQHQRDYGRPQVIRMLALLLSACAAHVPPTRLAPDRDVSRAVMLFRDAAPHAPHASSVKGQCFLRFPSASVVPSLFRTFSRRFPRRAAVGALAWAVICRCSCEHSRCSKTLRNCTRRLHPTTTTTRRSATTREVRTTQRPPRPTLNTKTFSGGLNAAQTHRHETVTTSNKLQRPTSEFAQIRGDFDAASRHRTPSNTALPGQTHAQSNRLETHRHKTVTIPASFNVRRAKFTRIRGDFDAGAKHNISSSKVLPGQIEAQIENSRSEQQTANTPTQNRNDCDKFQRPASEFARIDGDFNARARHHLAKTNSNTD